MTGGDRPHFFGYYDKCPWNASERYLLVHEASFSGRQPKPGEEVSVGILDAVDGGRLRVLGKTSAWSWQQGASCAWLPSAPDRKVVYNVRLGNGWGTRVVDVELGATRILPFPVYALSPDGSRALFLNFSRLAWTRPGYGYEGIPDPGRHVPAPEDDGVFAGDIRSGSSRLLISLAELVRHRPKAVFAESYHWVNHLSFSPDGTRFLFLHRWVVPGSGRRSRLYSASADGKNLRLLLDHDLVSHFCWRDSRTVLVWARHPNAGDRFYLLDERTGAAKAAAPSVLTQDGHMSYSPDRRWIVGDTYPDSRNIRTLYLFRAADGKKIEIGRFFSPPALKGPVRCDLHPRWNREGTKICIDSAHEKVRQVYVVDVSRILNSSF